MNPSTTRLVVLLLLGAMFASVQAGEADPARVVIYTGQTGWIGKADADVQAQICVNKLNAWGIPNKWFQVATDKPALADWMTEKTGNGEVDVLILYGVFPETIYPAGNAMTNGSIAELFIESTDGDMIINHGDAMFYVTGAGANNGYAGLENMMDTVGITQMADNTPMKITAAGKAIASSLTPFWSDRMFFPAQFKGEWFVEAALGVNYTGAAVEPAIVRDGNRGRLMMCFQTNGEPWNPKGAVAAEVCAWVCNVHRGAPVSVGVRAVNAMRAEIPRLTGGGRTDPTAVAWAGEPLEVTVDLLEATGSGTTATGDVTVNLGSSSATGRFDTSAGGSFDGSVTSVVIPAGSTCVDVYYLDRAGGTHTLTAAAAGLSVGSRQVKLFARSYAPGGQVAFYTARASWCTPEVAYAQSQIAMAKLNILGITSTIFPTLADEAALAAWMTARTGNGELDVLVLFGAVPPSIYPGSNAQPDGSVAELFIESTDGDAIINHGDAFWYVSAPNNTYAGLQHLTDLPLFNQNPGAVAAVVTPLGELIAPSLVNFTADRPFALDMLLNNWLVEAALATDATGKRADPVCIRDGDRGRIIPVMQRNDNSLPKGAVAADIISVLHGYAPAEPVQFGIAGRSLGGAAEPLRFKAQVQGLTGSPTRAPADTVVALNSDSPTGRFDIAVNGAFNGSVTSLLLPAGTKEMVFYYKDTADGEHVLTASAAGFTPATKNVKLFPKTAKPAGEVAIYTGATWWFDKGFADAEADIFAARLADAGITVTLFRNFADQLALADWVSARTDNGKVDVLILYGVFPRSIYPTSGAFTDGTIAELFIESTDGDTIINSGDWMFYCDADEGPGAPRYNNGAAGLQSMMDTPGIGMSADNTPVWVTERGKAIAPSMRSFLTDRPFFPEQFGGEWYVEAGIAWDASGTRVEPAVVRDGNRGRLVALLQTNCIDANQPREPKGSAAAEIVAWIMDIELKPVKLGIGNEGGAAVAFARDPVKLTVNLLDATNVPTPAAAAVTANLASNVPGAFDFDKHGNFDGSVTSVTFPAGTASATVYFRPRVAGTATVSATDAGAVLGGGDLAVKVYESPVLQPGSVAIYTGTVGWTSKPDADAQAEICVDRLNAAGIPNTWYPNFGDELAVADWVSDATNNGKVDVLVLYGSLPHTFYPFPGNPMMDGSLVELFIESLDGDLVINHADWIFYVSSAGCCNGQEALEFLMDRPSWTFPLWGDDIQMYVTEEGAEIAPSLKPFWSDRAFRIPDLWDEWSVEAALARDAFGTRADPVIVRDGPRGRLAPVFQAANQPDPKGAVAAEIITWIMDTIIVDTVPVAAIAAAPLAGKAPLEVAFSAAGSIHDGAVATYSWNFGDGGTAEGMEVVHTYTGVGTYVATVTVTDDMGDTGTASVTITADLAPVAVISAAPLAGRAPLEVSFSAAGSTDDGTIEKYAWDFGDGETAEGVEVSHTYAAGGEYTVVLTVTDNFGNTGTASVEIAVEPAGTRFKRGDTNADGTVDLADAICTLGYLFGPASDPCKAKVANCLDAADANDDGAIDLADAIKVLSHLFGDGGPLPEPFAACGLDPTDDAIGCEVFPACR